VGGTANQRAGRYPDVVEVQQPLLLRRDDLHLDRGAGQARRVGGYEEQGRLQLSGRGVFGTGDDEDEVTFVHAGDERLAALDEPVVAVAPGDRAEAVEVRAGLGLGDG